MKDGLHERLAALLADVCGAPPSTLGPDAAPGVTPGWDSVATLSFIAAVEDELGISITTAEAMTIKSLADMARLVAAKSGASGGS
jgi:acyl carrier protein